MHKNKRAKTNTHTHTNAVTLSSQSWAEACFDAKLSGNSVFPFFLLIVLFTFPGQLCVGAVTKSLFPSNDADVLDRTKAG